MMFYVKRAAEVLNGVVIHPTKGIAKNEYVHDDGFTDC